jgi:vanillate O-demethylase ferredoxin subunit
VAENVMQIQLAPSEGTVGFSVGSHLDVMVLIGESQEIRSYSLLGTPQSNTSYTISVKRLSNSRGGSAYMWSLEKGSRLRISQPTNHFELDYRAKEYLLIAGGIGITPILGMAEQLTGLEDKTVRMLYLGQSVQEMPYLERLSAILGDRLIIHFSEKQGRYDMTNLLELATAETQVYLCGPIGLMNAVRKVWEDGPYDLQQLRYETFGASGLFAPQEFCVTLPRFNLTLNVKSNQTLLSALDEAGIAVMYDCKKGECGLCQVDVLEYSGDIDHRDFFFSESEKGENKKMCACVSRVANGSVRIDTGYRGK